MSVAGATARVVVLFCSVDQDTRGAESSAKQVGDNNGEGGASFQQRASNEDEQQMILESTAGKKESRHHSCRSVEHGADKEYIRASPPLVTLLSPRPSVRRSVRPSNQRCWGTSRAPGAALVCMENSLPRVDVPRKLQQWINRRGSGR